MAITVVDYHLWHELRDQGLLPEKPAVLEFGQANWYGDVDPDEIPKDIGKYAEPTQILDLLELLRESRMPVNPFAKERPEDTFGIARAFYGAMLRYREIVAVDLHGRSEALKLDLNEPLDLPRWHYDILINSGTAEHVFDQRQVWKSAHEHTRGGGLMVHALPLWNWLDHGLYNYHPTTVADLAATNGYEIVKWWWAEIDTGHMTAVRCPEDFRVVADRFGTRHNAMMYVVFRKSETASVFKVPMQGYYAGRLTPEARKAWQEDQWNK